MRVTTQGFIAIVICAMLGLGGGAMFVKNKELKEAELSSETVVEPPIVEVVVEPEPKFIDPFVEDVIDVKESTEEVIDTMAGEAK